MKRRLKWAASALMLIVVCSVAWSHSANVRGRMMARIDLSRGKCRVLTFGMGAPHPEEAEMFRTRYGVELKAVAQCIVSPGLMEYVRGYNKVSREALRRKFGRDVVLSTFEEVERTKIRECARRDGISVLNCIFSYPLAERRRPGTCLQSLPKDASVYVMAELCGRPDDEVGKDDFIFLYRFPDGTTAAVHAPSTRRITEIRIKDSEGREFVTTRN